MRANVFTEKPESLVPHTHTHAQKNAKTLLRVKDANISAGF